MTPTISTLVPVGPNYEPTWLKRAIQSTLDQKGDFNHEVVICMDGAPFPPGWLDWPKTVNFWGRPDRHSGVAAALNGAFHFCNGEYIARIDADDESKPGRYAEQLLALDFDDVCGTWMDSICGVLDIEPLTPMELLLKGRVPVFHPTMMCRRKVMETVKYPEGYMHAEDYAFHCLAVKAGFRYTNIPHPFVVYGHHEGQMSRIHRQEQKESTQRALKELLKEPI